MYQKIPKLTVSRPRDYLGEKKWQPEFTKNNPKNTLTSSKSSSALLHNLDAKVSNDITSRMTKQKSQQNLQLLNKYAQPLAFEKFQKKRILKNMVIQNQTNEKLKYKNTNQYRSKGDLHSPYKDIDSYKIRSQDKYAKYEKNINSNDKLEFISKKINPLKQTSETISSLSNKFQLFKQRSPRHQKPITTFTIKDFRKIKQVGKGKNGRVWLAQQRLTNYCVAIKMIQKTLIKKANNLDQFIRQLKIQAFLKHPSIIQLYGFFQDAYHFYIILEFGCDGQLYDLIEEGVTFNEAAISSVMKPLLTGVDYLHENSILHRDIKPQNIVLSYGVMKLCDFGCAVKIKPNQMRTTFCGTPLYFSPQLLKEKKYNEKVDIWALGILAYELFFQGSPFQIQSQQDLEKIVIDKIKFPSDQSISEQFKCFLLKILQKNPNKRLNCKKLLNLAFIKNHTDNQCIELLKS